MEANKKWYKSLIFRLVVGLVLGVVIGRFANEALMQVFGSLKHLLGQLILYCVPLIIIGFIAPAIVALKENAGKMLSVTLVIAYLSSVGAAFFSVFSGYALIPHLHIASSTEAGRQLPELFFKLDIPQIMPVMTALVTAVLLGLATLWTKAKLVEDLLNEFNRIVLAIVDRVVITLLPFFIFFTFATLSYEGEIISQFPVFLKVLVIVILGHYIWLALLYTLGGVLSKTNPLKVLKHYGPAYVTALGTMSSAASLSMCLKSASKAPTLDPRTRDFVVPLCSNCHLCGSVLTETFFVMTVSQILYNRLPSISSMVLFALLLGIFAIAAPGVPGGTVVASLGLITGVLGFNEAGVALMLSIFALQDSFGTACNITGDGAIALMVTGIFKKVPKRQVASPQD